MTTEQKNKLALQVIKSVLDAVKEAGRIPCGTLYAACMTHGATLEQYQSMEQAMIKTTLIKKEGNELIWNAS